MKQLSYKIGMNVRVKNFYQSFRLTWLFSLIGLIIYIIFHQLASLMPIRSFFYYFLKNTGMFLMFTTVLLAYSGVYRIATSPDGMKKITRNAIRETLKKSHYILGISFLTVILLTVIVLIEVGFSSISLIPYAGSVIMALLTIPIFLLNFICLLTALCVFSLAPPLVAEALTFKDIFTEIKVSITERWINVLLFIFVSLALFVISVYLLHYLAKYSIGMTKAVQWRLDKVYPAIIKSFSMKSYFTDLVTRITPGFSSLIEYREYGRHLNVLNTIIKYIISLSYIVLVSFLVSFPLAIYFNSASIFFGRVRVDGIDKVK